MAGLDYFMATRKANKAADNNVTTPVAYPTGFMPLDYLNGQRVKVFDENDNLVEEYDSVGFVEGTMITVISDPGLGKTTLSQQCSVNIASQFDDSFVNHEDIEQASHINRVYNITGQKPRWIRNHYVIFQDTHTEAFISRFIDHARTKLNNRKVFEYDTGLKDMFNQPIKRLIPTIVLLDSLAVMRSEDGSFDADGKSKVKDDIGDTTGNMFGARNAKFNSEMFKQILPFAKKANIILIVINQINRKISTGFVPMARDLVGMGENETISGGRASLYLANNVLRLKNKGMLKPDKDFGINGNLIEAVYYKSRTAATNVPFELVFDKQNGFSIALSMLNLLMKEDKVKKSGTKYYFPELENITFTKKNFCETAAEHPELLNRMYDLCLPLLQKHLTVDTGLDSRESADDMMDSYMNVLSLLNDD